MVFESHVSLYQPPTMDEFKLGSVAHFTKTPLGADVENTDEAVKRVTLAVACFKQEHFSVLEFAEMVFLVRCPIFVARQLFRHRNGTFMEKSLRSLEPTQFKPTSYADETTTSAEDIYDHAYCVSYEAYKRLLECGEQKERARAVLPLATPTEFLWKINLRSLLNVFEQRLDPAAQKETREVVGKMYQLVKPYFPNIFHVIEDESLYGTR